MQVLKKGPIKNPQVLLLQRQINLQAAHNVLKEDGYFGARTLKEVKAYQTHKHLVDNGIVDKMTWRSLGIKIEINHFVTLVPQWSGSTCWSAATTMLFGDRSVGPGAAAVLPDTSLEPSNANIEAFARSHGLKKYGLATLTVQGLASLLRKGPLVAIGIQPVGAPRGPQGLHAVVIGALWGNGGIYGKGTMLQIYDPWPPGIGSKYGVFYGDRIAQAPIGMIYILQR